MTEQFDFIAPTGDELQGTLESVSAACTLDFTGSDPATDYEHNGANTEVFWDGMTTQTLVGVPLFLCESGEEWAAHQLIPAAAEPLSAETLELFRREHVLGLAVDEAALFLTRLDKLRALIGESIPPAYASAVRLSQDHLRQLHDLAKADSIAARGRELKAQEEASPRVECSDCGWTGRERDCGEIQSLHSRVAPGETMPAGECPDCGALCHLTETEEA